MGDDGGVFWHGFHGLRGFGFLVGIKCGKGGGRKAKWVKREVVK
jgi:hypothetical protein